MTAAVSLALLDPAALGWTLLALAVILAFRAVRGPDPDPIGWKWWTLVAVALLYLRWPMLWVQHQLNPDESQLIAGAITLRYDPLFWRSVDGGTAGPVDYYPLLPVAWSPGFSSYAVARLIALAVAFGTVVFAGETLALLAGAGLARVAVLPALAAMAFTTSPDLSNYSTELMPALLLAAAAYAAVRHDRGRTAGWLWLFAVLLGAVPWAKLQATPVSAVMGLLVLAHELRAGRTRSLLPLVTGALLPTVVCVGGAALTGQLQHLYVPYVLNNFEYVGAPNFSWAGVAAGQWQNALSDGYLAFWLAGAVVFLLPVALRYARHAPGPARRFALSALLLLMAGIYSALAPRRPSAHHLQLVPLPMLWVTGSVLALAWTLEPGASRQRLRIAAAFLLFCLGPQVIWRIAGRDAFAGINAQDASPSRRQLAELVQACSRPGEPLAIWGWRCSLYVEAGRPQATRQAQTEAQIKDGPLQSYFLRRYFEDFSAAAPPVFADAVGPNGFAFMDRAKAHESFPPLRAWVAEKYTQIAELDGTRLYVRNDRLAAVKLAPLPPSGH